MLWVLCVCDRLLKHDLDLEHPPLLGWWHLSVLLPWTGVLPLWHPWPWLLLWVDLQQELKWFLKPHLWHFLPNAGQSLYECVMLHLLQVLLSLLLGPLTLCELSFPVPYLLHLKVLIASMVIGCAIPQFDLWRLKSFTIISCSLVYWSRAWYVTSSCSFSISPTSWLWSVWSHEITILFYIPVYHLPCTGIFWLYSWFAYQVGRLTHCLLVLYCCISHLCGSSRRSRLQGCLLWPWKLLQGPFGPPHHWRWVVYSISWTLP